MAEQLVPQGQPYGERQQTEAQMQRAGLPLGFTDVDGPDRQVTPQPGFQPNPASFDALTVLEPSPPERQIPGRSPMAPTMMQALESPNPAIREIAARLLRRPRRGG